MNSESFKNYYFVIYRFAKKKHKISVGNNYKYINEKNNNYMLKNIEFLHE